MATTSNTRKDRTPLMYYPRGFAPRTPLHAHSRAASSARSVRVAHSLRSFAYAFCLCFLPWLPPSPPGLDAREQDQSGHDEHGEIENPAFLIRRQRDAAILRILGADRDEIFLLRQPVRGVQEEVAVPLDAQRGVAREVRIAERDDARLDRLRCLLGLGRVLGRRRRR